MDKLLRTPVHCTGLPEHTVQPETKVAKYKEKRLLFVRWLYNPGLCCVISFAERGRWEREQSWLYCDGLHACCSVSASEIEKSYSFISLIDKVFPRERPVWQLWASLENKGILLENFFFICFVSFQLRKSEAGMVWSNHEKIHFPVMGVTKMPACICGTGIRALNCVGYSRTLSSLLCSARCLLLPWLELGRVLGAPGRSLPSCPVLLGWELMPCYHPRLSGAVYWSPC